MSKARSKIHANNLTTRVALIAACFIAFLLLQSIAAQTLPPGSLDPTFGIGGIVTTSFNFGTPGGDDARAAAIQADGKIVVAGYTSTPSYVGSDLVRYNPDGSLDPSFGSGGKVILSIENGYIIVTSVAIQPDSKIVVGGTAYYIGCSYFAVVRYNTDGSLDTSFNGSGTTSVADGCQDTGSAVAIQPDGKIVLGGTAWIFEYGIPNVAAVRYNSNGSLDTSFGNGGRAIFYDFADPSNANSLAIQPDGQILLGGSTAADLHTRDYFYLVRFDVNGSPDGATFTDISQDDSARAHAIAIQPDGKIVVAGSAVIIAINGGYDHFVVARYNPDLSLDSSFGGGGIAITDLGSPREAYTVAIQRDGKIVAGGGTEHYGFNSSFDLVRYNANGSLDQSFGDNGRVYTQIGSRSIAYSIAPPADGKIVAVGSSQSNPESPTVFAVARYVSSPLSKAFDFDGDGRSDVSVFRPSDSVWYLNRSTDGFSATQFGLPTDKLVPADYDGDGKTDVAVFRDGVWWRIDSFDNTIASVQFGHVGDIPVPADYTGDGRDELAVYRDGRWWSLDLSTNQVDTVQFGISTDKPVPADYDGDGKADQAVYRDGDWHLNRSSLGYTAVPFGLPTDRPVPADYDGDGKTDPAVYRDGTWYILGSQTGFTAFQWGVATDIAAPSDYDGDGKADAAIYRYGVWWVLKSTGGYNAIQYGLPDDKPIPAAFIP